ncbi:hypothetical protein LB505_010762 [Fusarium chuoi]|nr:hypothetical protein LB505_010762 [Fusarium chuoi]
MTLPPPTTDVPSMAKYPFYPSFPGNSSESFQCSREGDAAGYSYPSSYSPVPGPFPDRRFSSSPSILTPSPGASDGLSPTSIPGVPRVLKHQATCINMDKFPRHGLHQAIPRTPSALRPRLSQPLVNSTLLDEPTQFTTKVPECINTTTLEVLSPRLLEVTDSQHPLTMYINPSRLRSRAGVARPLHQASRHLNRLRVEF